MNIYPEEERWDLAAGSSALHGALEVAFGSPGSWRPSPALFENEKAFAILPVFVKAFFESDKVFAILPVFVKAFPK